jgi:hypothetical protein
LGLVGSHDPTANLNKRPTFRKHSRFVRKVYQRVQIENPTEHIGKKAETLRIRQIYF